MEIRIVESPFQGVDTTPKDMNHPNDTWSVEESLYRNFDGGMNLWFKEIERVKPDTIYLYEVKSYNEKIVNGEELVDDIVTSIRYQFKKGGDD